MLISAAHQASLNEEVTKDKWQCKGEDPDPNWDVCDYWNHNSWLHCSWCGAPKPKPPSQGPFR